MACKDCPPLPVPPPQHAVAFKAWYTEGRFYEGDFDAWAQLPEDGVLAVRVIFDDGTARICMGDDWYAVNRFPDGYWTVIHNSHQEAMNRKRYPNACWKQGSWTSEAEMLTIKAKSV